MNFVIFSSFSFWNKLFCFQLLSKMDIDVEQLKKMTPEQQAQVLQGIKQQAALASAQGLIAVRLL